jgi:hypothetical protein
MKKITEKGFFLFANKKEDSLPVPLSFGMVGRSGFEPLAPTVSR